MNIYLRSKKICNLCTVKDEKTNTDDVTSGGKAGLVRGIKRLFVT